MATYLEEHGQHEHWYESRRNPVTLGVVHTAEIVPDLEGVDDAAGRLLRYAATTTRSVSWHDTTDRDSHVETLPLGWTAWHVRGYNSRSVGDEQALYARSWPDLTDEQIAEYIEQTAKAVARWVEAFDLPLRVLTKKQADAEMKGLVAHATLDPGRRSDPGADFPWPLLLRMAHDLTSAPVEEVAPEPPRKREKQAGLLQFGDENGDVANWQRALKRWEPRSLPGFGVDGDFGGETRFWTRAFQKFAAITVDGIVGPQTREAMRKALSGRTSVDAQAGFKLPDFGGTLLTQPPARQFSQAKVWQRALNAWRKGVVKVDGWYGPITETWTRTFQRAAGVKVDGIVGPKTWAAMRRVVS